MNSALMIKLLPGWLIYIVMYAATIKIRERRLTFVQSHLMSAIAAVVENRSSKKRLAAIEKQATVEVGWIGHATTPHAPAWVCGRRQQAAENTRPAQIMLCANG